MLRKLHIYLLVIVCLLTKEAFSQAPAGKEVVMVVYKGKKVNTRKIRNPAFLAQVLTYGRESDREKFQAIFRWVAVNVDYDYKSYFSSGGVQQPDLMKFLKKKRGVCVHYASLLDTLCELSGITSELIYGYAKDDLFDLGDSLYVDNHVWNAVKLGGLWYLCDVTYASGTPYYRYTRFSRLIVHLMEKYAIRYRKVELKKRSRFFFKYDCLIEDSIANAKPAVKYEAIVVNKLIYSLLRQFKLRVVRDYAKKYNPGYSMVNPEMLAVTHYPDNPEWALLPKKTVRQFETDSAFYYLVDSLLQSSPGNGRFCAYCDGERSLDEYNRNVILRKSSSDFNKRNRFISSFCEYNIAGITYKEGQKARDSLTKVTLLDSSLSFYTHSASNILAAYLNTQTDYALQKAKNNKKLFLLVDENEKHLEAINQQIVLGDLETKNVRDLQNSMDIFAKKFYRRNLIIKAFTPSKEVNQTAVMVESATRILKSKELILQRSIDSLTRLIQLNQQGFDQGLQPLTSLIWKKVFEYDSLLKPLKISTDFRRYMKDNLKREVVDVRQKYNRAEKNYSHDLDSLIYKPAASLFVKANTVLRLMDERYLLHTESYKIKRQLLKFKVIKPTDLDDYRSFIRNENHANFCWVRGGPGYLRSVFYGFQSLGQRLNEVSRLLKAEMQVEGARFRCINKELYRREIKYQTILRYNRKIVNRDAKIVRKYKRAYLKSLREALLEERKKK